VQSMWTRSVNYVENRDTSVLMMNGASCMLWLWFKFCPFMAAMEENSFFFSFCTFLSDLPFGACAAQPRLSTTTKQCVVTVKVSHWNANKGFSVRENLFGDTTVVSERK